MTGRYKTYPEYKDSGSEWVGNIPVQWETTKLKYIFDIQKRIAGEVGYDVLSITQRGIKVKDIESGDGQLSMDYSKYQLVYKGDFAMNHMDLLTGYVDISSFDGVTSPDYRVFRLINCTRFYDRYYLYLLQFCYKQKVFFPLGQGSAHLGRWRLPTEAFNEVEYPTPSFSEQQQIANFLDYETAKIDTLIDKQEKLIELLKEKRQAVISHAVTKGLNPDAPMKDSGVEWLGEVPEHWSVIRLRFLCDITTGSRDTQDAKENGQYPFFVRSEKVQSIDTYSFEGEGVMTSGDGAGVGKIYHHFIGKCEIHQRVYLFHNFKHITPRYFYYFLKQNLEPVALAQSAKSTVDSLRLPILQEFRMCFGDESEQKVICEYVDSLSEKYDGLIDGANKAIELMKERKIALISAAVTGKVDVRDWQESA